MSKRLQSLAALLAIVAIGVGIAVGAGGHAIPTLGASALLGCALLSFAIQWIAAIPAILLQTERHYDLTGSLTYLTLIGLALWLAASRGLLDASRWVPAGLAAAWALRLGTFLFRRIHRAGSDGRFDEIKRSPLRFLLAWTLQGLWVFVTALALLILLTDARPHAIGPITVAGWGLWALGFGVEVVADAQKSAFNADEANRGRWIDVGLWGRSRHPNYFGEILLWAGIFVSGIPAYTGWQWLAALSPLFVYLLLTRVSGIPLLDQRAKQKWGEDPGYQAYRRRTRALLPWPPRRPPREG